MFLLEYWNFSPEPKLDTWQTKLTCENFRVNIGRRGKTLIWRTTFHGFLPVVFRFSQLTFSRNVCEMMGWAIGFGQYDQAITKEWVTICSQSHNVGKKWWIVYFCADHTPWKDFYSIFMVWRFIVFRWLKWGAIVIWRPSD